MSCADLNIKQTVIKKAVKGVKKVALPIALGLLFSVAARTVGIVGAGMQRGQSRENILRRLSKIDPNKDWAFLVFMPSGFILNELLRSIRSNKEEATGNK